MISRLTRKLGHLGVRLWAPLLLLALVVLAVSVAALYGTYRRVITVLPADEAYHIANLFTSILIFSVVLALVLAIGVFITRRVVRAAIAMESTKLYGEEQRRARELSLVNRISRTITASLDLETTLNAILASVRELLPYAASEVCLWEPERNLIFPRGWDGDQAYRQLATDVYAPDEGYTGWIFRHQKPLLIPNISTFDEVKPKVDLARLSLNAYIGVPLMVGDTFVGTLELVSQEVNAYGPQDLDTLQTVANQIAIALRNAQLFSLTDERLRKRVEELSGLQRVSQELNSTLDQDRILRLVLREVMRATGADFGNVSLYDRGSKQLLSHVDSGFNDQEIARLKNAFYAETGVIGRVMQTGLPVLISDVSLDFDYVATSSQTRSQATVPIFYAGDVAGVINLESRQLNAFSEAQLRYLEALANQAAIAIRNTLAYEEQRQQRELLRRRADQLARLSEISHAFRSDQPLESVLEDIVYAVQETLGFNAVLISVMQGDPPMLHRVAGAGIPIAEMKRLKADPQSPQVVMDLMQDCFRLGLQSYYIPHVYKEIWEGRLDVYYTQSEYLSEPGGGRWDAEDLCFSPLYNSGHQLIGVLSVDNPQDGRIPTPPVMETLELFANQAAMAIENAQLFRSEQQRRRLADTLREVAAVVSSTLKVDQVIEAILDQLQHVVPYDSATVQVLRGDRLVVTGGRGWDNLGDVLGLAFPMAGDNPNHIVVHSRAPYIVPDTQAAYAAFRKPPHSHIRSWLGVPLLFGDNLLGMIALDSVELDYYTHEHAQLALTFANQVAMALQNAQLFEQVRQYADRLYVMNEVGVEITSILNVDDLIARVSQLVEDNFGYRANISLVGEGIIDWVSASAPTPGASDGAHVEAEVACSDLSAVERKTDCSEIAIPLKVQDRVLGVFEVQSDAPAAFSENDLLVLRSLAGQTAVAIANAQLFERVNRMGQELEQRVQERTEALARTLEDLTLERDRVETLYRITRELSASLDLDRVLNEALGLINRAVGVAHGSIMLLDPGTGNLVCRAALGRSRGLQRDGMMTRYRRGVGLAGWVLETHEPVIVPDLREDPHWIPSEKEPYPERRSAIGVPLTAGDDVLGVLILFHPEVGYFTPDHLRLVSAAATQVATAINNAQLYRLITDQAERVGIMLRTQRAEAAKHQAIVEGIADGVLVLDPDYHVVLMNPAASRILGLSASVVEGQHVREILGRAGSAIDRALAQQLYDRLLAGMKRFSAAGHLQSSEVASFDFRLQAEDKVVVVSLSPVSLGGGGAFSLVTVLRDISREAEMERMKNEFISTVSHELRTPMTAIKGYTDLLIGEKIGPLSGQQRHFVQVIKANADRLAALVNDFLDISRIETGRVRLKIRDLDLSRLIHDVVDNFRGQMSEKSLELVLDLPPMLPPVRGDEDRVTQILENLASNAWKYTPEGGQVTVRAGVVDGFVQVDVSDTGIGIAEKDQEHIFERFYRTDQAEVQAVDGTGLGLSIVKMCVELLGGEVWVESRVNEGSTFSFTLPLAVRTSVGPAGGDARTPTLLIVDDAEYITRAVSRQRVASQ